MNGSLVMRSTRLRTLLLILVGGGMVLSLYLLTSSQYHLKDARHLLEACQQQKDSLLAQLQVVYEQKNRVEKYLQQEKLDHSKTQEENQKNNFLRLQVQKAKAEVDTKLSALQKEQVTLQEKYQELEAQTKDLHDQQTRNEEKNSKLQSDLKRNLLVKDEENSLLRGNLSIVLQERDRLENQVVQLNDNIQQLKRDFLHYKRLYVEVSQHMKNMNKPVSPNDIPAALNVDQKEQPLLDLDLPKKDDPGHGLNTFKPQLDHLQGFNMKAHESVPQRNREQRHPLVAPKMAANQEKAIAQEASTQKNAVGIPDSNGPEGAGHIPSGLRQQLQPPDFIRDQVQRAAYISPASVSSPSHNAGGNQPLLLPPPPSFQDSKPAGDVPQLEVGPDHHDL